MKLKCVIFDFDGTLFDSMYLWDTVAESYVRSRGKEPKPTVREEVRALSLLQAAEHLKKEYDLAETPEEIMAGIDRIIEHFYRDEVQPKPGVVPFLKELRAKGVDVCIATATDRYLIEAALRRAASRPSSTRSSHAARSGTARTSPSSSAVRWSILARSAAAPWSSRTPSTPSRLRKKTALPSRRSLTRAKSARTRSERWRTAISRALSNWSNSGQ